MGFLAKGVLLYLLLAVAIAFAAPSIIFSSDSPSDSTVLSWFNIRLNSTDNSIYYNTTTYSITGEANTSYSQLLTTPALPTGTGFLGFIDPLLHVFSWIATFGKVLVSPIIMFTHPEMTGAPIAILMIIGIPIVLLFLLGIIGFIRNGEM
jgi:hypothetical protein